MKDKTFKPGTVVIFDPKNLNAKYWDNLPEKDRKNIMVNLDMGKRK